ncbi:hypothetical protein Q1695_012464 [Nippostrongylus brasiliensis]|nr:hypothetical protein Q1695_012464 [Nippostrongylus brasiliensis]
MGDTARFLAIYGGTTFLVYVETDGFKKMSSSMMFGLPLIALSFLSLISPMQQRARICSAASFAVLALSRYVLLSKSSWEMTVIGYALVSIANLLYFYSFQHLIEEWSIALSMFLTMFYCTLAYYSFADLTASIPFLVFLHACSFGTSCLLVVAAGSVCMNNIETDYETYQAALIRLVGTLLIVGSNTIFLISMFGRRVETLQIISRLMFYVSQGLLYLANERTF